MFKQPQTSYSGWLFSGVKQIALIFKCKPISELNDESLKVNYVWQTFVYTQNEANKLVLYITMGCRDFGNMIVQIDLTNDVDFQIRNWFHLFALLFD